MKLKDTTLKAIEPSDKEIKLSDGYGLFFRVQPSGAKSWVYIYRFGGKQKN